ncbi:MAG: sugar ABC transporter substrate-binding protein [Rubripirellula sp.]
MSRFPTMLLLSLVFLGCSSSTLTTESTNLGQSDSSGQNTQVAKPRIALIMKSLANEFFSTMASGAEAHQSEHGSDYELLANGIKNESDVSRQVGIVDEMVAAGVDAIVIAPADSKVLIPALQKAKNAGVVIVNIDNRLDTEFMAKVGVSIPFVGPDNRVGAKKVGDFLASKLSKTDKVAILEGKITAFNGVQRRLGFEDAMKEAGIEVVSSQSADWEADKANKVAAAMLSEHPDIRAILAANDSMALGAIAAVKSAGKSDEVMVVGFDNINAVQKLIADGKVLATADQHGDQLAVFGIETALKLLQNPDIVADDVETPVDLVTTATLAN